MPPLQRLWRLAVKSFQGHLVAPLAERPTLGFGSASDLQAHEIQSHVGPVLSRRRLDILSLPLPPPPKQVKLN